MNPRLILASSSPRRKELLRNAGFTFDVAHISADETYPSDMSVAQIALHLAEYKNKEARKQLAKEAIIITADTIVVCDQTVLGKPVDEHDAIRMLNMLNDRTHSVITGVCVSSAVNQVVFDDETEVMFKKLSVDEIQHYVSVYQPMDKAGAYGIQEWIGLIGVKEIRGSYFNVVGLPLQKLYQVLTDQFNISRLPLPH